MATLIGEAHLIRDMLSGGNAPLDSQLSPQDIMMYYRGVMQADMVEGHLMRMTVGDRSQLAMYIYSYSGDNAINVEEDEGEDIRFITLPDLYMELPYNKGIVRVSPQGQRTVQFRRLNNPYVAKNLSVANMETEPSYWPEGLRIIFSEFNWNKEWNDKKIDLKIILPAPTAILEDDPLPIFPNQIKQIRDKVTQYFAEGGKIIQDVLNDGNKDRGVNLPVENG